MTIYKTLNQEKPHILPEHQTEESNSTETSGITTPSHDIEHRVSEFYDETDVMKSKDSKDRH